MKKAITMAAMILAVAIVLSSCSSTKTATTTSNVSHGRVSGTWMVSNISYEGIIENNVQTIFDLAPPTAFQNSTWTLTGSGNGTIALTNGTVQPIYWSLNEAQSPASFQFKKVNSGEKARNVTTGYSMDVSSADANNVVLRLPVDTGGTRAYIILNMTKK
jgi:uncharacterized protein YceK